MRSLRIVPLLPAPLHALGSLTIRLGAAFSAPTLLDPHPRIQVNGAFDPSRNQYYSTALIASLLAKYTDPGESILAVTAVDLFVPVLTYVFGEAQLSGRVAVLSSHRLDETFYGFPPDPGKFSDRLLKEALHELGHVFGLLHCMKYECVMHSSTAVEEIDLKPAAFCPECSGKLGMGIPVF